MDGMQLHATCLKLGALSRLNVFLLYGEHGHVVAGTRRLRLNREAPAGLSNAVVEIHRTPVRAPFPLSRSALSLSMPLLALEAAI